eukprot:8602882-Prorocentrum_lima.AAC.1
MTSSLVGSEMCIRDSEKVVGTSFGVYVVQAIRRRPEGMRYDDDAWKGVCLLYTSDAADDM